MCVVSAQERGRKRRNASLTLKAFKIYGEEIARVDKDIFICLFERINLKRIYNAPVYYCCGSLRGILKKQREHSPGAVYMCAREMAFLPPPSRSDANKI